MRRRSRLSIVTIPALLLGSLGLTAGPVYAACDTAASLENGGFETPGVGPGGFSFFDASLVPPWITTDTSNEVEIWGDGFIGVPSAEGENFAELNANSAGTLYQDVLTTPGDTMTWSLQHRGRDGDDAMRVLIGDEATADVTSDSGWDFISGDLSDPNTAWGTHTDDYVVPTGQVCTRFAFRAVSTGSGSDTIGNFIDDISFTIAVPEPEPTAVPTAPPTDGIAIGTDRSDGSLLAGLLLTFLLGLTFSVRRMHRSADSDGTVG